jgi:hypothetical protein
MRPIARGAEAHLDKAVYLAIQIIASGLWEGAGILNERYFGRKSL